MAKAKPSGTRMRRAIAAQLAMTAPQQLPSSGNDLLRADFQQTLVRLRAASVRRGTGRTAQNDAAGSERTIARRIRGAKNPHHRNAQSGGQVHRSSVATYEQSRAASERNQLRKRTGNAFGSAPACRLHCSRQILLAGTEIDQRLQAIFRQSSCHIAVTLSRPLLGSPARPWVEKYEVA